MANPEHVEVVRKGKDAIQSWRKDHPSEVFDLAGIHLMGIPLVSVDLSKADLSKASLISVHLGKADLSGANLTDAVVVYTMLPLAKLDGATLHRAELKTSDCFSASFSGADLSLADLFETNFKYSDLRQANLSGADLKGVTLFRTNVTDANFADSVLDETVIADCDLSHAKGLGEARHESPSSIGLDTMIKSFRGAGNRLTQDLESFFLSAGVPQDFLSRLPRLASEIRYSNAFVCYGAPDKAIAAKLVEDLRVRGISCWLYSMDYTVGERTWEEIGRVRRETEKMIVLCSMKALVRDGVLKEIEEQIDENPDKIVPVSLDELWKEEGFHVVRDERDLKPFLLERNFADFSKESDYKESLGRLLKGLERQHQ
jgi:uncharacterized protein YjbI with pentapeptide repeats